MPVALPNLLDRVEGGNCEYENRRIFGQMNRVRYLLPLFKEAVSFFIGVKLTEPNEDAIQDFYATSGQKLILRDLYPVADWWGNIFNEMITDNYDKLNA